MNKIIFLDIDGVLNGYDFFRIVGWRIACCLHIQKWYKQHTRRPFTIHEEKVKRLAKIVHSTNAKVVMSSSWRNIFWNDPYEDKSEDQKLLVDLLDKYNIEVIDITPESLDGRRDKEILQWLLFHESCNFVILDDEKADLKCFVDNLVQTSSIFKGYWCMSAGLKRKHVKKAIEILNR